LLHFPLVRNVSETTVRVRYAETDQMGIVYYANYFVWFEIGRVELMRQLGFDYRDMERADGCFIAVADARCRYKAPARYDDLITIRTRLKGCVARSSISSMKSCDKRTARCWLKEKPRTWSPTRR